MAPEIINVGLQLDLKDAQSQLNSFRTDFENLKQSFEDAPNATNAFNQSIDRSIEMIDMLSKKIDKSDGSNSETFQRDVSAGLEELTAMKKLFSSSGTFSSDAARSMFSGLSSSVQKELDSATNAIGSMIKTSIKSLKSSTVAGMARELMGSTQAQDIFKGLAHTDSKTYQRYIETLLPRIAPTYLFDDYSMLRYGTIAKGSRNTSPLNLIPAGFQKSFQSGEYVKAYDQSKTGYMQPYQRSQLKNMIMENDAALRAAEATKGMLRYGSNGRAQFAYDITPQMYDEFRQHLFDDFVNRASGMASRRINPFALQSEDEARRFTGRMTSSSAGRALKALSDIDAISSADNLWTAASYGSGFQQLEREAKRSLEQYEISKIKFGDLFGGSGNAGRVTISESPNTRMLGLTGQHNKFTDKVLLVSADGYDRNNSQQVEYLESLLSKKPIAIPGTRKSYIAQNIHGTGPNAVIRMVEANAYEEVRRNELKWLEDNGLVGPNGLNGQNFWNDFISDDYVFKTIKDLRKHYDATGKGWSPGYKTNSSFADKTFGVVDLSKISDSGVTSKLADGLAWFTEGILPVRDFQGRSGIAGKGTFHSLDGFKTMGEWARAMGLANSKGEFKLPGPNGEVDLTDLAGMVDISTIKNLQAYSNFTTPEQLNVAYSKLLGHYGMSVMSSYEDAETRAKGIGSQAMAFVKLSEPLQREQMKEYARRMKLLDTEAGVREYLMGDPDNYLGELVRSGKMSISSPTVQGWVRAEKESLIQRIASGEWIDFGESPSVKNQMLNRSAAAAIIGFNPNEDRQTLLAKIREKYKSKTGGKELTLSDEDLSGVFALDKGQIVDFANPDEENVSIIRSPSGYGNFVYGKNYAKQAREVYKALGISPSGVYLSNEDMATIGGADWDGDKVKTLYGGIGAAVKEAAVLHESMMKAIGSYAEAMANPVGTETTGDLVANAKQARLALEGAIDATPKMGSASSAGMRATMFDLTNPYNRDYLIAAVQANKAYELATTSAKDATEVLLPDEMKKALYAGAQWSKLPTKYSRFFNTTGLDNVDIPSPENIASYNVGGRNVDINLDELRAVDFDKINFRSIYTPSDLAGLRTAMKASAELGGVDDTRVQALLMALDQNIGYGDAGEKTKALMQNLRMMKAYDIANPGRIMSSEEVDNLDRMIVEAENEIKKQANQLENPNEYDSYKQKKRNEYGVSAARAFIERGIHEKNLRYLFGDDWESALPELADRSRTPLPLLNTPSEMNLNKIDIQAEQETVRAKDEEVKQLNEEIEARKDRISTIKKETNNNEDAQKEREKLDSEIIKEEERLKKQREKGIEAHINQKRENDPEYTLPTKDEILSIIDNTKKQIKEEQEILNERQEDFALYDKHPDLFANAQKQRDQNYIEESKKRIADLTQQLDVAERSLDAYYGEVSSPKLEALKQERAKLNRNDEQAQLENEVEDLEAKRNKALSERNNSAALIKDTYDYIAAQEKYNSLMATTREFSNSLASNIRKNEQRLEETPQAELYYGRNIGMARSMMNNLEAFSKEAVFEKLPEDFKHEVKEMLVGKNNLLASVEKDFAETTELKAKQLDEYFDKALKKQEGPASSLQLRFDQYDKRYKEAVEYRNQLYKNKENQNLTPEQRAELDQRYNYANEYLITAKKSMEQLKINDITSALDKYQSSFDNPFEKIAKGAEEAKAEVSQLMELFKTELTQQGFSESKINEKLKPYEGLIGKIDQRAANQKELLKLQTQYDNDSFIARGRALRSTGYGLYQNNSFIVRALQRRESALDQARNRDLEARRRLQEATSYRDRLNRDSDPDGYNRANETVAALQQEVNDASSAIETLQSPVGVGIALLDQFGEAVGRVAQRLGRQIFQKALQETRQFVMQFDASMNEIQAITLKSDEEMQTVRSDTINRAINLRTSVSNVATTEAALYRQGLSDSEVAERSESILKFAAVTKLNVSDATKIITTALQNDLVPSAEQAMDTLVALGDSAATSAAEIGKGMQKAAASAKVAGVSYAQLTTLLTIGTSDTQLSGTQVGTALQTVFSRMRRLSLSGYTADINGEKTTTGDAEAALKTVGVDLFTDSTKRQMRSSYDVLVDLAKVWQTLSDAQKSIVTNAMAGTRQTNIFSTLMEGMGENGGETLDKYLGLAEDSAGITQTKYEIAMQSLQASIDEVKSSWDLLVESFTNNGAITGGLDAVSGLLQWIANIGDNGGQIGIVFSVIAAGITKIAVAAIPALGAFAPLVALISALAVGIGGIALTGGLTNLFHKETDEEALRKKIAEYDKNINEGVDNRNARQTEKDDAIERVRKLGKAYSDLDKSASEAEKSIAGDKLKQGLYELKAAFPDLSDTINKAIESLTGWTGAVEAADEASKQFLQGNVRTTAQEVHTKHQDAAQEKYEQMLAEGTPDYIGLYNKATAFDDRGLSTGNDNLSFLYSLALDVQDNKKGSAFWDEVLSNQKINPYTDIWSDLKSVAEKAGHNGIGQVTNYAAEYTQNLVDDFIDDNVFDEEIVSITSAIDELNAEAASALAPIQEKLNTLKGRVVESQEDLATSADIGFVADAWTTMIKNGNIPEGVFTEAEINDINNIRSNDFIYQWFLDKVKKGDTLNETFGKIAEIYYENVSDGSNWQDIFEFDRNLNDRMPEIIASRMSELTHDSAVPKTVSDRVFNEAYKSFGTDSSMLVDTEAQIRDIALTAALRYANDRNLTLNSKIQETKDEYDSINAEYEDKIADLNKKMTEVEESREINKINAGEGAKDEFNNRLQGMVSVIDEYKSDYDKDTIDYNRNAARSFAELMVDDYAQSIANIARASGEEFDSEFITKLIKTYVTTPEIFDKHINPDTGKIDASAVDEIINSFIDGWVYAEDKTGYIESYAEQHPELYKYHVNGQHFNTQERAVEAAAAANIPYAEITDENGNAIMQTVDQLIASSILLNNGNNTKRALNELIYGRSISYSDLTQQQKDTLKDLGFEEEVIPEYNEKNKNILRQAGIFVPRSIDKFKSMDELKSYYDDFGQSGVLANIISGNAEILSAYLMEKNGQIDFSNFQNVVKNSGAGRSLGSQMLDAIKNAIDQNLLTVEDLRTDINLDGVYNLFKTLVGDSADDVLNAIEDGLKDADVFKEYEKTAAALRIKEGMQYVRGYDTFAANAITGLYGVDYDKLELQQSVRSETLKFAEYNDALTRYEQNRMRAEDYDTLSSYSGIDSIALRNGYDATKLRSDYNTRYNEALSNYQNMFNAMLIAEEIEPYENTPDGLKFNVNAVPDTIKKALSDLGLTLDDNGKVTWSIPETPTLSHEAITDSYKNIYSGIYRNINAGIEEWNQENGIKALVPKEEDYQYLMQNDSSFRTMITGGADYTTIANYIKTMAEGGTPTLYNTYMQELSKLFGGDINLASLSTARQSYIDAQRDEQRALYDTVLSMVPESMRNYIVSGQGNREEAMLDYLTQYYSDTDYRNLRQEDRSRYAQNRAIYEAGTEEQRQQMITGYLDQVQAIQQAMFGAETYSGFNSQNAAPLMNLLGFSNEKQLADAWGTDNGETVRKTLEQKQNDLLNEFSAVLGASLTPGDYSSFKNELQTMANEADGSVKTFLESLIKALDIGGLIPESGALSFADSYQSTINGFEGSRMSQRMNQYLSENFDTAAKIANRTGRSIIDVLSNNDEMKAIDLTGKYFSENPETARMLSAYQEGRLTAKQMQAYTYGQFLGTEKDSDYYDMLASSLFTDSAYSNGKFMPDTLKKEFESLKGDDVLGVLLDDLISKFPALTDAAKGTAGAIEEVNDEVNAAAVSDMTKYSKGASNLSKILTGLKKGGKDAAVATAMMAKNLNGYQDQITAVSKARGKSGKELDSQTLSILGGVFPEIDSESIKQMTEEQLDSILDAAEQSANKMATADFSSLWNNILDNMDINVDWSQVHVNSDGTIDFGNLEADAQAAVQTAIDVLRSYAGDIASLEFINSETGERIDVKALLRENGKGGYHGGGGSGGGGGKSDLDKLLESQKHRTGSIEHENKMLELRTEDAARSNDVELYQQLIDEQIDGQTKLRDAYQQNLEELYKQLDALDEESDDWWKVKEAIDSTEEALAGYNAGIDELIRKRLQEVTEQYEFNSGLNTHEGNMLNIENRRERRLNSYTAWRENIAQRGANIQAQLALDNTQLQVLQDALTEKVNNGTGDDDYARELRNKINELVESSATLAEDIKDLANEVVELNRTMTENALVTPTHMETMYGMQADIERRNREWGYAAGTYNMEEENYKEQQQIYRDNIARNREELTNTVKESVQWYNLLKEIYADEEALMNLTIKQMDLELQRIEDVKTAYDDILSHVEHGKNMSMGMFEYNDYFNNYSSMLENLNEYEAHLNDDYNIRTSEIAELQSRLNNPELTKEAREAIISAMEEAEEARLQTLQAINEASDKRFSLFSEKQERELSPLTHENEMLNFAQEQYRSLNDYENYLAAVEASNNIHRDIIATLRDQKAELEAEQSLVDEGTEAWWNWQKRIEEVTKSLEENKKAIDENEAKYLEAMKHKQQNEDKPGSYTLDMLSIATERYQLVEDDEAWNTAMSERLETIRNEIALNDRQLEEANAALDRYVIGDERWLAARDEVWRIKKDTAQKENEALKIEKQIDEYRVNALKKQIQNEDRNENHAFDMLGIEAERAQLASDDEAYASVMRERIERLKGSIEQNRKQVADAEAVLSELIIESPEWFAARDEIWALKKDTAQKENEALRIELELDRQRLNNLQRNQQNEDRPGLHAFDMLSIAAERAKLLEDDEAWEGVMNQRIEIIRNEIELNAKQLAEAEALLATLELDSEEWIATRNQIWEIKKSTAQLENEALQIEKQLDEERLARIKEEETRRSAYARHLSTMMDTASNVYQNFGNYDNYRTALTNQYNAYQDIRSSAIQARDAALEQMSTLEKGTDAWYAARDAVYAYDEAINSATNTMLDKQLAIEQSNIKQVTQEFEDSQLRNDTMLQIIRSQRQAYESQDNYAAADALGQQETALLNQQISDRTAYVEKLKQLLAETTKQTAGWYDLRKQIASELTTIASMNSEIDRLAIEREQSVVDRMLERMNFEDADRKHNLTLIQYEQTKYQNAGELTNYGVMLEKENKLREESIRANQRDIQTLKAQQAALGAGAKQYNRITEEIRKKEEAIEADTVAIKKNIKALKENENEINKTRKALEDTVENEIKKREEERKNMLNAEVEMQRIILETIKDRYRDEWNLEREDIEKKRDALEKEKALINERLDARKKAMETEEKYRELEELQRQLALISNDPTRTKDARELREQINNIEKDISWEKAYKEADAATQRIDDEIQAMSDYVTIHGDNLEEMLSNANNFSEQIAMIMEGGWESISSYLIANNTEFKNSLAEAQQEMLEGWEQTWKEMMGIVDTYWDQIAEILSSYESFANFMKDSTEYINSSDVGKAILEYGWEILYQQWQSSGLLSPEAVNYDTHNHQWYEPSSAGYSGIGDIDLSRLDAGKEPPMVTQDESLLQVPDYNNYGVDTRPHAVEPSLIVTNDDYRDVYGSNKNVIFTPVEKDDSYYGFGKIREETKIVLPNPDVDGGEKSNNYEDGTSHNKPISNNTNVEPGQIVPSKPTTQPQQPAEIPIFTPIVEQPHEDYTQLGKDEDETTTPEKTPEEQPEKQPEKEPEPVVVPQNQPSDKDIESMSDDLKSIAEIITNSNDPNTVIQAGKGPLNLNEEWKESATSFTHVPSGTTVPKLETLTPEVQESIMKTEIRNPSSSGLSGLNPLFNDAVSGLNNLVNNLNNMTPPVIDTGDRYSGLSTSKNYDQKDDPGQKVVKGYYPSADPSQVFGTIAEARSYIMRQIDLYKNLPNKKALYDKWNNSTIEKKYKYGGLIDYTGPAWVDGTPSAPESFLNAEDTEALRKLTDALTFVSIGAGVWPGVNDLTRSDTNFGNISITINQAELKDDADYEDVAKRIGKAFTKEMSRKGYNLTGYNL